MRRTARSRPGLQPMPPGGPRRSSIQDAGSANPYLRRPGRPVLAPTPYVGAYAGRRAVSGSAITLVVVSAVCLFPFLLVTQLPALIIGLMAINARDDLARADRLARRGWWAFAAGLAAIVALFVSAAALLFSVILAVIG